MRRGLIIVLVCLASLIAGCVSSGDKRVKRLSSHKLVFPSSLERIEGTGETHPDLTAQAIRLIIYVDSTECSSCRVNSLHGYTKFASLDPRQPQIQISVILWPNSETAGTIDKDIAHRNLPFDVFIDRDGSFLDANSFLPRVGRNYHAFLLDADGKPLMVGDPLSGAGMDRLLRNVLYSLYNGD